MSEYKYLDKDGLIYYHSKVKNLLGGKVDKVDGKGLSTNDYTTTEKNKLNGIATGAEVNQNAFSNIAVGSTTIAADSKTDTLELVAGSNVTLTPDATNDKVTISATDTTYSDATTSSSGLMSASDKTNLNIVDSLVKGGDYHTQSISHPFVVPEWKQGQTYNLDVAVTHNGSLYKCIVDQSTSSSFVTNEWYHFDLLNWNAELTQSVFGINNNFDAVWETMNYSFGDVPSYSSSTNYHVGDLVFVDVYGSPTGYYRCIEDTSGSWDSTKWDQTGVFEEIELLKDAGYITSADYATTTTAGIIKLGSNASIHNGVIIALAGTADALWDRTAPNYFASYDNVYYAITSHIDTSLSSSSDDVHYPSSKCVYDAINDAIGSITGISFEVVQELPQTGETGTIYLLSNSGTSPNVYDEYIWLASYSSFEKIGTTDVDLSGYVQKTEMVAITNAEIDSIVA